MANHLIGDNERSIPFGRDFQRGQPNYECPGPGSPNHDWAEYKTSLLIQTMALTPAVHTRLLEFLKGIGQRLSTRLRENMDTELDSYVLALNNNPDDVKKDYPVGQLNVQSMKNPDAINSDFFAFFNFLKSIWYKFREHPIIVNIQQNGTFNILTNYRGKREDLVANGSSDERTDAQTGITNIRDRFLDRRVAGAGVSPEGWYHAGARCRLPYRGKYGQLIREEKDRSGYFGSLKCGISGSVNFLLYLYLMSIHGDNMSLPDAENAVNDLVLSCCMYLAGDGGHTVREILYGLIFCCSLLNKVGTEYRNVLGLGLVAMYRDFFTGNVIRFLDRFCARFSRINITGVLERDLPVDINRNTDGYFRAYTTIMMRAFLARQFPSNPPGVNGVVTNEMTNLWGYSQLYFALESNRYKNNNFYYAANEAIRDIVKKIDPSVIEAVNARLQRHLTNCRSTEIATFIPFAFNPKR
jgi:hypothetical protein